MGRILFLLTVFVTLQLYVLVIYEYGEAYGFNDHINPLSIIAVILSLIGILWPIRRNRKNQETKRENTSHENNDEQVH